jgi:lysine 2,3-aminomutase
MAQLIDPADPNDPIARQFRPAPQELLASPEERADPIGDDAHEVAPGLIHRYPDRALLKLVAHCAVYCRFCFRRETVGPAKGAGYAQQRFTEAARYIAKTPAIWEVIFSGGDPLVLSPRRIRHVTATIAAIPHVKVLRWHTRVPAVKPDAITTDLIAALKATDKAVYVVLHANHPRELTPQARAACARLIDRGIPMLSQSVLLRGINDTPEILTALMRAFVETRIKPYYLHHLDRAPGTEHFRTSIKSGQNLAAHLKRNASGLCQPAYMLDIPGGFGKVPIGPTYLHATVAAPDRTAHQVADPSGETHTYVEAHPNGTMKTEN